MTPEDLPRDPSLTDPLPDAPLALLERWLEEARGAQRDPWAMCVASVNAHAKPSARMVICRGYDALRGFVVFHTNRESRKAHDFAAQPIAAAVFHWTDLHRQVRLEGPVDLLPEAESDAYFASRPRTSQIGAWASRQSEPIASRQELLEALAATEARFGDGDVPRPPFWGGYRIWFGAVELWVGAEGRLHDRAAWERELVPTDDGFAGGAWKLSRLQP